MKSLRVARRVLMGLSLSMTATCCLLGTSAPAAVPGSSAPSSAPRPRVIAFFGDSSTSPLYSPPGFPALVGVLVGSRIHNLATLSDTRNVASYSVAQAFSEQLERVPNDTTDAVIFLGIDDLSSLSDGHETLQDVENSYSKLLNALKDRKISVHLITLRNYSLDPKFRNPPPGNIAQWQTNTQRVTDAFDDWLVSLGYPTLDIRKFPELMDDNSYTDAIHFSKVGLQRMANRTAQLLVPDGKPAPGKTAP